MPGNSSEPWRVSEQEMREYERKMGEPMSEATRDCLEFEYERAFELSQQMSQPEGAQQMCQPEGAMFKNKIEFGPDKGVMLLKNKTEFGPDKGYENFHYLEE